MAILLICLHNLLHDVCRINECEFAFIPHRVTQLFAAKVSTLSEAVLLLFSFWGWYGVPIFVFLSGYGLVMKYEKRDTPLRFWSFLKWNYLKLFLLLIVPLMFVFRPFFQPYLLLQLSFTINIVDPEAITPGVYWYFGLTLQLYILYVFFYHKRSNWWLLGVSLAMLLLDFLLTMSPYIVYHYRFRHNSPLWLPVFLMGVWFARGGKDGRFMGWIERHRLLSVITFFILWFVSTVTRVLWVLGPVFFVLMTISVFHDRKGDARQDKSTAWFPGIMKKCLVYVGVISPGVFVWHPYFRNMASKAIKGGENFWLVIFLYLLATIVVAAIFTPLFKKSLAGMQKWLKTNQQPIEKA